MTFLGKSVKQLETKLGRALQGILHGVLFIKALLVFDKKILLFENRFLA